MDYCEARRQLVDRLSPETHAEKTTRLLQELSFDLAEGPFHVDADRHHPLPLRDWQCRDLIESAAMHSWVQSISEADLGHQGEDRCYTGVQLVAMYLQDRLLQLARQATLEAIQAAVTEVEDQRLRDLAAGTGAVAHACGPVLQR